jgi:K+-sensing histidine kinase KdpD
MPTPEKVDKIHDILDAGARELGEILTALTMGKVPEAKGAVFRATRALGDCKEALRVLGTATPAQTSTSTDAPSDERQRRWIEHDSELRAKGQEFMVTAAAMAVALALSVTFREALASSQLSVPLLIKVTWLAFALCVVCAIAERFMSSMRFTIHAVGPSMPSKVERWWLGRLHLLALFACALGIVALVAFGWVNL